MKDVAKLAVWAQDYIHSLERQVQDLKQELLAQQCIEPSRVQWGAVRRGIEAYGFLRDHERIAFSLKTDAGDRTIRVHLSLDMTQLECHCDGGLLIHSAASNWASIMVRE